MDFINVKLPGTTLHCAVAGNERDPLVILLHGFPEFWKGWEKIIQPLAERGYFVVAPDQRGYNLSSKPRWMPEYTMNHLVADVLNLATHFSKERFHLAGHDFGGLVTWAALMLHPQRIHKAVILNAPHPVPSLKALMTNGRQILKSWYIFAYQIPTLPELMIKATRYQFFTDIMRKSSLPGTFTNDDFKQYIKAWDRKGALTAMINWYRASVLFAPKYDSPWIDTPVKIIWGERDQYIDLTLAKKSAELCRNGSVDLIDATHWLLHEKPDLVTEKMHQFLQ